MIVSKFMVQVHVHMFPRTSQHLICIEYESNGTKKNDFKKKKDEVWPFLYMRNEAQASRSSTSRDKS